MKWLRNSLKMLAMIITILACVSASAAETQAEQVVRVAFPETKGLCETYEDGTRGGVVYEWLVEIAKYTNWEYEFVEDDLSETLKGMSAGKYDLMGAILKVPGFGENFYYPDYLIGFNNSLLLYNKDDYSIKSFDVRSIEGKTIGVFKNAAAKLKRLYNVLDFNNVACQMKYYSDADAFEQALDQREVDLLLVNDTYKRVSDYNVALRFDSEPCYIVAQKANQQICWQLNEAIKKIYASNPDFGKNVFQKYFPVNYRNAVKLSEQELSFMQKNNPLKVAVVENNYPFYSQFDGKQAGIVPGIFAWLTVQTGATFEYVKAGSYDKALEMVKAGQADILGCFINDDNITGTEGINITQSYMTLGSTVVRNKYFDAVDGQQTVAVIRGIKAPSGITYGTVLNFDTYEECLRAVNDGKASYTRVPDIVLEDLYRYDYYANIIPVVYNPRIYLSMGVSKNADTRYYAILNKSLLNLTDVQISQVISNSTLLQTEKELSFKAFVYSNPVAFSLIIIGFIVLTATIIFMYFWFKMKNQVIHLKMQRVENLSKVRSEFLSRMSHEIRTPLNAIIGLVNLMKLSGEGDLTAQKNISKIDSSAKFLLSIVNDVLDMSKIESGKIQLENRPFSIEKLLDQLQNIFQVMAEARNINLQFKYYFTNKNFIGDELRLKQVLINLLSNAHKFTEANGEIQVTVLESAAEEGTSELRFSVCDTGIGIPETDLERIFGSFEQVFRKSRSSQQGTGLGLAISRNLVELMGGILSVRSEVEKGSEFFFTVKLPVYEKQLDENLDNNDEIREYGCLNGKNILLAEDNDLNAEIAVTMLEMQGIHVERVVNGQQAVDRFQETLPGTYDLILMDLQMPVKNGLEATAEIRALERVDAREIPIVAMTANTMQEDRENALATGMNGFIPKPFDVDQLYQSIERFLH
ncbi:ATP-binding protein [Phascolarctobacterium sp.]